MPPNDREPWRQGPQAWEPPPFGDTRNGQHRPDQRTPEETRPASFQYGQSESSQPTFGPSATGQPPFAQRYAPQPGSGFASPQQPTFQAPPRPQFAPAQQFGADEQLRAELAQRTLSRTQRKLRGARAWAWVWALLLPVGLVAGSFGGYWYALNARTLDERTVEQQVTEVLRDDFGFTTLAKTDCPGNVKIAQGESFQCSFEYAGGAQTVTVTQGSESGQLVVGAPEPK